MVEFNSKFSTNQNEQITMDEFMSLSQQGTIVEYYDEFKLLLDKVKVFEDFSEDYATYLFIFGLKPEFGDILMGYHNWDKGLRLEQAFSLAKLQERCLNLDSFQGISSDLEVRNSALQQTNNYVTPSVNENGLESVASPFKKIENAPKMFDKLPRKVISEIKSVLGDDSIKDEKGFDANQNERSEVYSYHDSSDSETSTVMSNHELNIEVFHSLKSSYGQLNWVMNNLNNEHEILNIRINKKDVFSMLKNIGYSCYDTKEKDLNSGKAGNEFRCVVYSVECPTISWDKTINKLLVYDGGGGVMSSNLLDFSVEKNQDLQIDNGKETRNMDEYVGVFRLIKENNLRKKKKKQVNWIDTGWVCKIGCMDDDVEDTSDVSWIICLSNDVDSLDVRLLRIMVNLCLWVPVVETYIGYKDWSKGNLIIRFYERAKQSLIGDLSYSFFFTQVYLQLVYFHYDNSQQLHKSFFSVKSYDLFAELDLLKLTLHESNNGRAKLQVELCTIETNTSKLDTLRSEIDGLESKSTNQEYIANPYMLDDWW